MYIIIDIQIIINKKYLFIKYPKIFISKKLKKLNKMESLLKYNNSKSDSENSL